jgi:phosphorylcholine metabolism protein LicD
MRTRRGFLFTVIAGFVAMAFVVGSVIADELLGVLTKVDVEGKKLTVVEKDTDKEVVVKITDDTKQVTKKKGDAEPSEVKVDLEKLDTYVKKVQDAGKKGVQIKVIHEKGVASKIETKFGKRAKKAE